ncbi:MAG TPA: PRC-barrel domain-containing protein [Thermomicrobiales bacterium]|nr:PRC-barrel domain-containing protein [Thermomicrobiales bacterium]
MAGSEINIGAKVLTSDGKRIGDVDRIVVDGRTNQLVYLVVDKGMFAEGRLVAIDKVVSSDEHGVKLSIHSDEATKLPVFDKEVFLQARGPMGFGDPSGGVLNVQGAGNQWMVYGSSAGQMPRAGSSSLYRAAPVGNVSFQEVSSISESDLTISEGTHVVDSEGKTVGRVDEVFFDDERKISGFLVRAGRVFHHDLRVPRTWIDSITPDTIRLTITKDFATHHGASDADQ